MILGEVVIKSQDLRGCLRPTCASSCLYTSFGTREDDDARTEDEVTGYNIFFLTEESMCIERSLTRNFQVYTVYRRISVCIAYDYIHLYTAMKSE